MKIINREAFMALPDGAICCQGEPWAFGHWFRKDGNCGSTDYFMTSLDWTQMQDCGGSNDLIDKAEAAIRSGESIKMDFDSGGRDGCYMEDAVYCVLEDADIDVLCERFQDGKGKSHG